MRLQNNIPALQIVDVLPHLIAAGVEHQIDAAGRPENSLQIFDDRGSFRIVRHFQHGQIIKLRQTRQIMDFFTVDITGVRLTD